MSKKIQIDASDSRIRQAEQIVTAMAIKCPGCTEFQALVANLLQSVLDHPWVNEEMESNIRQEWATLVGAEVINDDVDDDWDDEEDDDE